MNAPVPALLGALLLAPATLAAQQPAPTFDHALVDYEMIASDRRTFNCRFAWSQHNRIGVSFESEGIAPNKAAGHPGIRSIKTEPALPE